MTRSYLKREIRENMMEACLMSKKLLPLRGWQLPISELKMRDKRFKNKRSDFFPKQLSPAGQIPPKRLISMVQAILFIYLFDF